MITWAQYRSISRISRRVSKAKWFSRLESILMPNPHTRITHDIFHSPSTDFLINFLGSPPMIAEPKNGLFLDAITRGIADIFTKNIGMENRFGLLSIRLHDTTLTIILTISPIPRKSLYRYLCRQYTLSQPPKTVRPIGSLPHLSHPYSFRKTFLFSWHRTSFITHLRSNSPPYLLTHRMMAICGLPNVSAIFQWKQYSRRPLSNSPIWKHSQSAGLVEIYTDVTVTSRILNWPSSTRAEIYAIMLAILISPRNSTINVYTDSLLIQEKDVTLQLHKVKGHSGDPGNDRADELAKEGLDHEFAFNNIFDHGNKDLSFMPSFQGTPIEQQLRKFLKTLMNFQTNSEWSQLKINNSAFTDRSQLYDWDVTWLVIKQEGETLLHLITCDHNYSQRKIINDSLLTFIEESCAELSQHDSSPPSLATFQRLSRSLIGSSARADEWTWFLHSGCSGRFDLHYITLIRKSLQWSRAKSVTLGAKILMKTISLFRKHMWVPRCDLIIKWERSRNITQQHKRSRSTSRIRSKPFIMIPSLLQLHGSTP
ncbi:hypothetical protein RclHR1_02690001 [Rhizophagus clarus]|uniref:Uncharacterized protein n=1 Tax=Rhizophagus clarus TaxID=94130 RepID=A0A2Z6RVR3_9GLOM|nr:hypothetical protein RclHR1_02690001 [Rhizophagus clarus]